MLDLTLLENNFWIGLRDSLINSNGISTHLELLNA